jgi:hypothetical protein
MMVYYVGYKITGDKYTNFSPQFTNEIDTGIWMSSLISECNDEFETFDEEPFIHSFYLEQALDIKE